MKKYNLNVILLMYNELTFDKFYYKNKVNNVILINASLKTKHHNYIINIEKNSNDPKNKKGFRREKYKNNKLMSIELCKEYIKDDDILKKIFNENKKKDDLSDVITQCLSYHILKLKKYHQK